MEKATIYSRYAKRIRAAKSTEDLQSLEDKITFLYNLGMGIFTVSELGKLYNLIMEEDIKLKNYYPSNKESL